MTERLDRIEALAAENTRSIAELKSAVNALVQVAEIHQQDIESTATATRELRESTQGNVTAMRELRESTRENAVEMADLRSAVNSLVQVAEIHQRNFEANERRFQDILAEIRGLRTETQRLIEHVLGNRENGA